MFEIESLKSKVVNLEQTLTEKDLCLKAFGDTQKELKRIQSLKQKIKVLQKELEQKSSTVNGLVNIIEGIKKDTKAEDSKEMRHKLEKQIKKQQILLNNQEIEYKQTIENLRHSESCLNMKSEKGLEIIQNLQNKLAKYKEKIGIKTNELQTLQQNMSELSVSEKGHKNTLKALELVHTNSTQTQMNAIQRIANERDELKEKYMELNDRYSTITLQFTSFKSEQNKGKKLNILSTSLINNSDNSMPALACQFIGNSSALTTQLKSDENNEMQSEDKQELDAYLKRVEYIHNRLDSNLLHITTAHTCVDECDFW